MQVLLHPTSSPPPPNSQIRTSSIHPFWSSCLHMAGHYIPQLAKLMIEFNQKEKLFNLKGVAVSILYA